MKGLYVSHTSVLYCVQNALRLDNSKVNGRCIKVEMSCGGGGRSTKRMDKIKEKNKKLVNKGGTLI